MIAAGLGLPDDLPTIVDAAGATAERVSETRRSPVGNGPAGHPALLSIVPRPKHCKSAAGVTCHRPGRPCSLAFRWPSIPATKRGRGRRQRRTGGRSPGPAGLLASYALPPSMTTSPPFPPPSPPSPPLIIPPTKLTPPPPFAPLILMSPPGPTLPFPPPTSVSSKCKSEGFPVEFGSGPFFDISASNSL